MAEKSKKANVLKEWHDLYRPLESGFYVPQADPFEGLSKIVVRNLIVDMEQLNTNLAERAPHWKELEVYADVLVFPLHSEAYDEFAFKLGDVANQKATFFARSIVIVDGDALFVNYDEQTRLAIFTSEITGGALRFFGVKGDPSASTPLEPQDGAVGLSISGSDTRAKAVLAAPPNMVAVDTSAYWLLESGFNVGSALAYAEPDLAGKILSWTSLMAGFGNDIDTQHLALNAANLQGFVMQLQRKIPFVPPLSEGVYRDISEKYLSSAASFEIAFDAKVATLDQLANVDTFVKANRDYFTDKTGVAKKLIDQMKANVADAEEVLKRNSDKLNDLIKHEGAIDRAREAFRGGVEKYKEEQRNKAILGVCMAVFELGASLALMAVGDEVAVAGAAKGAIDAAKAGEAAAKTVSKITKLANAMRKIAKTIEKLTKLIKKLEAAQEAIEKLVTADQLKTSDFGKGIEIPDKDNDVFDNAYWDVFTITISDILGPYTGEIDGAGAYLEQLRFLAVYGKAVYANQVSLTQLRQKLFELVLEEEITRKQQGRLEALVGQEEAKEELLQRAKIITYRNLLRVKGRVLFYMDEQAAALRYWAVEPKLPSDYLPSLGDTVGELKEKLAEIEKRRVNAMTKFNPTPQPMDVPLTIDQTILIERMRKTGRLSWTIPMDQKEFALFGRVRVERFRVYLNKEAIPDPDKTVIIEVSTSAHYYDRYKGAEVLEYVSTPFRKPFEYQSNREDRPIADGTTTDEFRFSYFEPTPFTTWTIEIKDTDSVDLSKLKTVRLELKGSGVAIR
uniref:Uncharacterized protein n=1 Tax=Candidatus Kentrum sp. TC TaxID=2126339 RepID=A0A450Z562_9GAMM|nr:MAG: hypothetical protein BECKTC1821D_GA0114238_10643 [Candidatus Kentron sp. TC]